MNADTIDKVTKKLEALALEALDRTSFSGSTVPTTVPVPPAAPTPNPDLGRFGEVLSLLERLNQIDPRRLVRDFIYSTPLGKEVDDELRRIVREELEGQLAAGGSAEGEQETPTPDQAPAGLMPAKAPAVAGAPAQEG